MDWKNLNFTRKQEFFLILQGLYWLNTKSNPHINVYDDWKKYFFITMISLETNCCFFLCASLYVLSTYHFSHTDIQINRGRKYKAYFKYGNKYKRLLFCFWMPASNYSPYAEKVVLLFQHYFLLWCVIFFLESYRFGEFN